MSQVSNITQQEPISANEYISQINNTLVIIDASVDNLEILKAGLQPGAEVVVLHPQSNGIEQITTLVSRRKNLQKVHLVSHGSIASLKLGACELNLDNLDDYSDQIQNWFTDSGDRVNSSGHGISLYIYGCQVAAGEKGQNFVEKLHQLTGANIAAATQVVGSSDNGGVWQLDYTTGTINSEIIFNDEVIQSYSGTFMDEGLTNFEGAEVQVEILAPDLNTSVEDPATAVVGDGIEFDDDAVSEDNSFTAPVDIDLAGGDAGTGTISITIDQEQTPGTFFEADFSGYVFTDVNDELPAIENVTIDESVNAIGLSADDITFSENSIEVNVEGLAYEPGFTSALNIDFATEDSSEETPAEPAFESVFGSLNDDTIEIFGSPKGISDSGY